MASVASDGLGEDNEAFLQAQETCRPGTAVLAYMALNEGVRTDEVFQVECSIMELRLRLMGIAASQELLDLLRETIRNQRPTREDMHLGAAGLAHDRAYFTIVFHAATTIERIHRRQTRLENPFDSETSVTVATLRDVANVTGWLPAP